MIENVETNLRPEVNSPSRILSESPDGKLRGVEPFRAICRWKAPMDDMTTIFTSWSLTNSCSHSLKQTRVIATFCCARQSIVQGSAGFAKICIAIMVGNASRLIQELRKKLAVATGAAWHHHLLSCKLQTSRRRKKSPVLSKEGSNI